MPRITAPTVAQHRAERHRALLDAAQQLLAEDPGQAPSLAAVAARAGLARSSVYEYFRSHRELLVALVREVLPRWSRRVAEAMAAAGTPGEKVLAYATVNLELVGEGEHAVATALAQHVPGEELHSSSHEMHEGMRAPLVAALAELGLPDPAATAGLVSAVVYHAARMIEEGAEITATQERVRELLAPFLLTGRS